jgi:predicted dehydrogenase
MFCLAAGAGSLASANDRKIRVAVLGTAHGHAATKIRTLRALPEYDFAGICRPDADEPNQGKVFEGVNWLSLDQVLRDSSIELVAVESRVGRNLQYARQCIGANKFVHLDKPPGKDLAGLRDLFAEARRRKRVVQLGYQWRYHPAMQAAMEAARKGWLGHVYAMRATIDKPLSREERAALAQVPGGIMFEDGCHLIDRAVALFGKPKKVTSFLRHDAPIPDGMIDNALAVLEYDSAFAEIHMAAFQPHGSEYRCLEILGDNGKAIVQPFAPIRLVVDLKEVAGPYRTGAQTLQPAPPPGPTYAPDFREMAHIIRDGAEPSYSNEHDLITQQTLLQVCGVRVNGKEV